MRVPYDPLPLPRKPWKRSGTVSRQEMDARMPGPRCS